MLLNIMIHYYYNVVNHYNYYLKQFDLKLC